MSPNETLRDPSAETEDEQRRPFWAVGLALLGFVIVVLAGGFVLDRQLRPRVGIEPAPATAPAGVATAVRTESTAGPASSATSVPAVASGDAVLPKVRVANSPLEREVEEVYFRYLQIYSHAVLNLDTSRLDEVLDGQALQLVTEEVSDRKARGRPLQVVADDYLIAFGPVTETNATLLNEYTSRSFVVDINTKQPLPRTSPPTRIRQVYVFRKVNGIWQIVDGTQDVLDEAGR